MLKNLFDSKITDRNIPIVISIANVEQPSKKYCMIFSKIYQALKTCFIFLKESNETIKKIIIETK